MGAVPAAGVAAITVHMIHTTTATIHNRQAAACHQWWATFEPMTFSRQTLISSHASAWCLLRWRANKGAGGDLRVDGDWCPPGGPHPSPTPPPPHLRAHPPRAHPPVHPPSSLFSHTNAPGVWQNLDPRAWRRFQVRKPPQRGGLKGVRFSIACGPAGA